MSVSNPVDSGGLRAFDHDLQGLAEQMNTVGGWAEIMAADSMNNTVDDEEPTREAVIDQQSAGQITYRSQRNPPFKAQIIGVQDNMDLDELYLFLGGDTKILDIDYGSSESHRKTRAVVTMCTEEDLEELVANKQLSFNGKPLRAWPLNSGGSRQSDSRQDDFRSHRDTYSRQNSNFGSTTSLASSHHGGHNRYDRGNRYDYGSRGNRCDDGPSRGHYQTLPNDRGPRGHYNGRKNSRGDRFDGGYDQRRYGSDLMRSESYSNDKDRPAPIYRSRTDDGLADRRSEMSSRANSQMSINQEPVRKPSNKDLFGDAKPVDSAKRLLELDEKEKQKKAEKEAEKQRFQHQQRMAQQHHQMPYSVYGHNYNIPPPNYVQPQPYYTIPQVPAFSGHASPAPGTIKIYQRDVSEREQAADMSPPLDPKHPTPSITEPQTKEHPIETIKEEPSPAIPHSDTTTQDKGPQMVIPRQSSGQSQPTNKPSFQKPRTFTRTTDARRSRGGFQGGSSRIDLTVESNSASEKNNNKEGATGQSSDSRLSRDNKEMHGSQASLASKRGGFRGGRGGRGGNRDRPPRERRPSREDHQKSAHGKEKNQSQQQRKTSRDEEPKAQPSISQTAPKSDVKNDVVKQEIPLSTPKAETAPAAGPVDAKEKKKEKKKKANAAKNNSTPLGSNKFSVLLEE